MKLTKVINGEPERDQLHYDKEKGTTSNQGRVVTSYAV